MSPALQRAYIYLVALVAVHMIVLGAANVLRVLAELALGAPSGGFTGLPFLFAEGRSRAAEIHREQMSLAIALLLVGVPAWLIHWRAGQRSAERSEVERASAWRSFYLHLVLFVTSLLVVFQLGFAARDVVRGVLGPEAFAQRNQLLGLAPSLPDPDWPARAAGALAMALAAAVAWRYHLRWSAADQASGIGASRVASLPGAPTPGAPAPRAAATIRIALRHLAVIVVGLFALQALSEIGSLLMRNAFPPPEPTFLEPLREPLPAPPVREGLPDPLLRDPTPQPLPRGPLRVARTFGPDLAERLTDRIPAVALFGAAWLLLWLREHRRADRADATASGIRGLLMYIALAISGAVALFGLGFTLGFTLQRLIPEGLPHDFGTTLGFELSGPLPLGMLFAAAWLYHRWVSARESVQAERGSGSAGPSEPTSLEQARAAGHVLEQAFVHEARSAAEARRLYTYAFSLAGVTMAAIGVAGVLGVVGSYVLGNQTHRSGEIALYVTLLVLGTLTWIHHWTTAQEHVRSAGESERSARWRRIALSLGVLGGVVAALAFGSGAVFRVVNAILAFEFGVVAVHDLWHLLSDTAVGVGVALFHWRALRTDRAMLAEVAPAPTVAPSPALVFVVPSPDETTRDRGLAALGGAGVRVYEADGAALAEVIRTLGPRT